MNEPIAIELASGTALIAADKSHCILVLTPKEGPAFQFRVSAQVGLGIAAQIEGACRTLRQVDPSSNRKPRGQRLEPR